jgi:hypothetical protein
MTLTKRHTISIAAITVVAIVVGIALGGFNRVAITPPTTFTTYVPPYATPEKVQAAVAAQRSCTPALSDIYLNQSPGPPYVYNIGCNGWIYVALIGLSNDPQEIEVNRIPDGKWDGRPLR